MLFPGYIPGMNTVIADDRGRVKVAQPGERFDVSKDAQGRIILRKLRPDPAELESVATVRVGQDGKLIWPKSIKKPSAEQISRAVRDDRDSR